MKTLVFVLLMFMICEGAVDYKKECVKKFQNLISGYFSVPQINGFADTAMPDLIEEKEADDIIGDLINFGVGNLTQPQYNQFSSLMVSAMMQYGSYQNINATIQKCLTGVNPILTKLYPKLTAKIKAAKQNYNAQSKAGFNFIFQKLTKTFMNSVVLACKAKLAASDWSKAFKLLTPYLKFAAMGVTS